MKLVTFILLSLGSAAYAAGPQWAYDTGKQTQNGAIIVKSVNGSTTYASTQNPTGAVAKTNQNATTQPPAVMIMATATLPIKVEGSVCNPVSSGVSPNEMADEGIAITADRSVLLSCQSGVWKRLGSASMARTNMAIGTIYTAASNGIVQFVGTSPYWTATINGVSYNFQYASGDVGRPQTTFPVLKGDTFSINCFCGLGSAFAIYNFYAVN